MGRTTSRRPWKATLTISYTRKISTTPSSKAPLISTIRKWITWRNYPRKTRKVNRKWNRCLANNYLRAFTKSTSTHPSSMCQKPLTKSPNLTLNATSWIPHLETNRWLPRRKPLLLPNSQWWLISRSFRTKRRGRKNPKGKLLLFQLTWSGSQESLLWVTELLTRN